MTQGRETNIVDVIALVLTLIGCLLTAAFTFPSGILGGVMGIGLGVLWLIFAGVVLFR